MENTPHYAVTLLTISNGGDFGEEKKQRIGKEKKEEKRKKKDTQKRRVISGKHSAAGS